jgi:hypothetical protein
MTGTFLVSSCWGHWIILVISVLSSNLRTTEEDPEHMYANSVIESRSPDRRMDFANTNTLAAEHTRPLSTHEKVSNELRQFHDMIDVVNILFMPSWGCLHLRCKWLLFSKSNTRPPLAFREAHRQCHSQCSICTKEYKKYMLPVVYDGVMSYLGSDHFRLGLHAGNPITFDNNDHLLGLLSNHPDYRKMVFGVKTVATYNINSFYFQLVASKIITFQKEKQNKIECVLMKDSNTYLYKDIKSWSGFQFRTARAGGAVVPYHVLTSRGFFRNYFNAD